MPSFSRNFSDIPINTKSRILRKLHKKILCIKKLRKKTSNTAVCKLCSNLISFKGKRSRGLLLWSGNNFRNRSEWSAFLHWKKEHSQHLHTTVIEGAWSCRVPGAISFSNTMLGMCQAGGYCFFLFFVSAATCPKPTRFYEYLWYSALYQLTCSSALVWSHRLSLIKSVIALSLIWLQVLNGSVVLQKFY